VWGGLALALLGVAGAGIGLMSSSWLLVVAGGLVLAVGACLGWAGGVMHDATTGLSPRREFHAVRDGTTHPGVAAGAQTGSPAAHDEAARQSRLTQQVLDQAHQATPAGWTRPAGWTLLLVAAVLLVSQWEVVAHTATGRTNSYRDTALVVVLALTGLRLALTPKPHRVAAAVAGLAGLVLLLTGVLAGHDHTSLAVVEGTTGVLTLVCAAAAAFSPAGSG
jgi:drug/metabolite transporter (DMT)-like permease